jgi:predicted PurR-regulated permease PerM
MTTQNDSSDEKTFVAKAVEASIRIAAIGVLVFWCVQIMAPFIAPILWGIIIAVAVYPIQSKLEKMFGGRKGLAATAVILLLLLILLVPAGLLTETLVSGVQGVGQQVREGTLKVPPPPANVETWPIVGKQVAGLWTMASVNLEKLIIQFSPELKAAGGWLLALVGQIGLTVLLFLLSIIVAGVLLAHAEGGIAVSEKFARRLMGGNGGEFVKLAGSTIRSVVRGILGIAFIQSVLAGILLLAAGIPGAGLWAFLCLLLVVMQIGTLPVLLPAAIYVWATAETLPAIIFTVCALLVGVSDNVLKPILLGRGTETPMLVILIGSLGGMIVAGIIGLFVGAVILTLGYQLFMAWLEQGTAA